MRPYRKTLVLGKFFPFHKGHELLIDSALALDSRLLIIVSDNRTNDTVYPILDRIDDIMEYIIKHHGTAGLKPTNIVRSYEDDCPHTEFDADGTATSEEFWNWWIHKISTYGGRFTHVVSSDRYGKVLAEKLNASWVPVDPDRVMYQISGTEIREDVLVCWDYLSDNVKRRFQKKIAIVGPESSGKSTLAKKIPDMIDSYYPCVSVPEYGRTISVEKSHELTSDDFDVIMRLQKAHVENAARNSLAPVIISDTDEFTTRLFMDVYGVDDTSESIAPEDIYDGYIVIEPVIEWHDDGERKVPSHKKRIEMFDRVLYNVKQSGKPYILITTDKRSLRVQEAIKFIESTFFDNVMKEEY